MSLPTKPWRPSFGPLPAALAGRIPVEPAFSERVRRAANHFYIDEMAAIREESDEGIARERQARLDETMDAAVEARRTGVLSPTAVRLLEACDTIFASATERKPAAERTSGGDRRPLPEVTSSGATKGGRHEDLAASGLPISTPVGTLLQLRPGQGVPVFDEDVTWDSRRRA